MGEPHGVGRQWAYGRYLCCYRALGIFQGGLGMSDEKSKAILIFGAVVVGAVVCLDHVNKVSKKIKKFLTKKGNSHGRNKRT